MPEMSVYKTSTVRQKITAATAFHPLRVFKIEMPADLLSAWSFQHTYGRPNIEKKMVHPESLLKISLTFGSTVVLHYAVKKIWC